MGFEVIFRGNNLERLLNGLLITSKIAFISVILACLFGLIFGVIMTSKNKFIRLTCRVYLEIVRIIPTLVWLFIVYFGVASILNIHLDGVFVAILVFVVWGTAEMGDLVRGAITSISVHQSESGKALGLSRLQVLRYILIPQAVKRVIPGAINLSTRMIKTSSLVVLIGVVEVIKVGQQIIENSILKEPTVSFWVYALIFFLYFIICYPLSCLSRYLERKLEV